MPFASRMVPRRRVAMYISLCLSLPVCLPRPVCLIYFQHSIHVNARQACTCQTTSIIPRHCRSRYPQLDHATVSSPPTLYNNTASLATRLYISSYTDHTLAKVNTIFATTLLERQIASFALPHLPIRTDWYPSSHAIHNELPPAAASPRRQASRPQAKWHCA
ncbi:hypothetical protein K431DRAFT_151469 [Polychaeton citri CBS 116435]|uniref:Secreted protein n=1 Tax=Polychaeton citri CBS 116435 TaxID=1314669 RepID=A0A9P4Q1C1_9PEZI|nr:hypothetical protein K431DRAFT_151469 [Polychaeton citri CBS 116435]